MKLTKYKLGDLLELSEVRNYNLKYGISDLRGISIHKTFIQTKADMTGVSVRPYYLVKPDDFAYVTVTSRNSEKITIAHNDTNETYIVSSSYIVFRVVNPNILNSDYLFIYFNRPEFDRYARFNSWGSARETFSWDDICDIEIALPPVSIQQKYVDIYKSMLVNQQVYESGLDDLKLVCDAYIEDLRSKMPCKEIRPYILECNNRNIDLRIDNLQGVNSGSQFGETKADTKGLDYRNYKIVQRNQFAYNPSRINLGSIAILKEEDCIVSPMYIVFRVTDESVLLPEYLMMWFGRKEFQRSTLYYASGSVRDTFGFDVMRDVKIPIPDVSLQQKIVELYNVYTLRKDINERLKNQIRDICPILIKGSVEEASK